MKTWLPLLFVGLMTGAWTWPKSTAVSGAEQGTPIVQVVRPGQQAGDPGEKGALYYALEGQTTRLTTKFRSGHVAVSERGRAGNVMTTMRDGGGNKVARLTVNRVDAGHDLVDYEAGDAAALQTMSDPNEVRPTLDWSVKQAYHLSKGGTDNLVWDKGTMRSKSKPPIDVDAEVSEVETEWAEGLSATMTRQVYGRRTIAGRSIGGSALVSDLKQNGTSVGTAIWFEKDRAFAFHIPQLMPSGMVVIFESDLMKTHGGWPFQPDTTWINLQVIATHHFKTLAAKNGSVSAKNCTDPTQKGRLARLSAFFVPTVLANDAGCDGLQSLNGGVVRDCCDDHDLCYFKDGCDSGTWWQFWRSWSCDRCNIGAIACFLVRGQLDPGCIRPRNPVCAG